MWKRRVTQLSAKKKTLSSLSCQLAAEEAYTTMSCNNSVILSNRLSRWASKSENERTCFDSGWPWGKESPGFFDLMAFFRSPIIFALWFSADSSWQSNAKAKLRQVRSVTNSKTNVKELMHVPVQKIVLTQSYDAKILPAASHLDAGRRVKDRGRTYIYLNDADKNLHLLAPQRKRFLFCIIISERGFLFLIKNLSRL